MDPTPEEILEAIDSIFDVEQRAMLRALVFSRLDDLVNFKREYLDASGVVDGQYAVK